jgi:beta-glucuronidase
MLYPRNSETREVVDVGGIWRFSVDKENQGVFERWYEQPLRNTVDIPVPSSYNDLFVDASIRDHIGLVWYERTVFIPRSWQGLRIDLRVGAAADSAIVYVNGKELMRHKGGFLPFAADIASLVRWDGDNRITICVDNRLTWQSLPPGEVVKRNESGVEYLQQEIHFDFFAYSGISRPVVLVATPRTRIEEMKVVTEVVAGQATVKYALDISGDASVVRLRLIDETDSVVSESTGACGVLQVDQPHLWEVGAAYLYTLEASIHDPQGTLIDRYRLPVGIRTVKVTAEQFLINDKPFYFKGFGKHEDSDFRGRGLDHALNVRDFNLLKWIGANSFRTSHYPLFRRNPRHGGSQRDRGHR